MSLLESNIQQTKHLKFTLACQYAAVELETNPEAILELEDYISNIKWMLQELTEELQYL
jgi:hypothetical protein